MVTQEIMRCGDAQKAMQSFRIVGEQTMTPLYAKRKCPKHSWPFVNCSFLMNFKHTIAHFLYLNSASALYFEAKPRR